MPKPRRKRNQQGHPKRVAQHRRRHDPTDPQEQELRELARLMRREATANSDEGLIVGPLAAAAKHAAEKLCVGPLDSAEHRHGVANYLTERLGAVLDKFDAEDYRAWREACVPSTLAR